MFNPEAHMMKLKGKDYLQVMWRIVWFREQHPEWAIDTEMVSHENEAAVFRAKILDESGALRSSGYGSESKRDFGDYLEKAETKAVGRALAMLGFGTQFAPELDEGERIVDSPVARQPVNANDLPTYKPKKATKAQLNEILAAANGDMETVQRGIEAFGFNSGKEVTSDKVEAIKELIKLNMEA